MGSGALIPWLTQTRQRTFVQGLERLLDGTRFIYGPKSHVFFKHGKKKIPESLYSVKSSNGIEKDAWKFILGQE